jgi:hypothetical protein
MIHKGKILGFEGSWGSGMGFLTLEDSETHRLMRIPCENSSTARALEAAFGNVIGRAHDVKSNGGHIGKEIYWSYDEMGLVLGGFTPVEENGCLFDE